jgi:hypothetical protein
LNSLSRIRASWGCSILASMNFWNARNMHPSTRMIAIDASQIWRLISHPKMLYENLEISTRRHGLWKRMIFSWASHYGEILVSMDEPLLKTFRKPPLFGADGEIQEITLKVQFWAAPVTTSNLRLELAVEFFHMTLFKIQKNVEHFQNVFHNFHDSFATYTLYSTQEQSSKLISGIGFWIVTKWADKEHQPSSYP